MPKVLIVTTSHDQLGDTGRPTGLWLEELAAPYYLLLDNGVEVVLASIKGGELPIDPRSVVDDTPPSVERFISDAGAVATMNETQPIVQVDGGSFDAIFLPGGHATMWDLPHSAPLAQAVGKAFDEDRIVAAVCHGPAGLVSAKRADGAPLVEGRRVTSFTNEEEQAVGLEETVPFLLETRLVELGAHYEKAEPFQPFAVRDGNLITGQNPPSSEQVAQSILEALGER